MAVTSSNCSCSLIKSCNIDSDRSILPPYKKLCNSWKKGEINLTIEHETGHCSVYRMAKREVLNADRSLAFDRWKVAPFKSCKIIMGIQKFI